MRFSSVLIVGIAASTALAQRPLPRAGGGGGGGTGHWRFERLVSGSTKVTKTSPTGATTSYTSPWYPSADEAGIIVDPGWSVSEDGSGSWTIRATWVDANGREGGAATNPPPPAKLLLNVGSSTSWIYTSLGSNGYFDSFGGDATNGFGDPYVDFVDNLGLNAYGSMSGHRIKKFNSSSGVVTFGVSQSVSGHLSASPNNRGGTIEVHHLTSAAEDTREAAIERVGAHDEWTDPNGNRGGDTIWSISGDQYNGDPATLVYSHFVPHWGGSWSAYPGANWPHENIEVKWDGLDCGYDYTPIYTFDESNTGIYLRRQNPFPTSGGGTLRLTLKDLGDGAEAEDAYSLVYHKPGDNWRQTGTRKEVESGPGERWTGEDRPMGESTYTVKADATRTIAVTDEINITGGFNWTIKKDTLAMPVALGYKHTSTKTVGTTVGVGLSGHWPDGAASLSVYTKVAKDYDTGLIDKYDAGGIIGKDVYAEQHAMDATYLELVVVFYDADGNPLG